jgi:hypothetical protein
MWEFNGSFVVNDDGDTMNDILRSLTDDYSKFDSYSLHINVNVIGLITSIKVVPFKYVRYGLPDAIGRHRFVKVSTNWEKDMMKTSSRGQEKVLTFPIWGDWTEEDRFGYVDYVVPNKDIYPLAVSDPILDSCQTDAESQVFELGNIQNGFLGTSIFRYPGSTVENPKERQDILEMLRQLKGSSGANSIGYVEISPNFTGPLLENIPANNNDTLFNTTNKNVLNRILMNYGTPKPVVGVQPETGLFSVEETENGFKIYNVRTRDGRKRISEHLNLLMQSWATAPIVLGKIKELTFENPDVIKTI